MREVRQPRTVARVPRRRGVERMSLILLADFLSACLSQISYLYTSATDFTRTRCIFYTQSVFPYRKILFRRGKPTFETTARIHTWYKFLQKINPKLFYPHPNTGSFSNTLLVPTHLLSYRDVGWVGFFPRRRGVERMSLILLADFLSACLSQISYLYTSATDFTRTRCIFYTQSVFPYRKILFRRGKPTFETTARIHTWYKFLQKINPKLFYPHPNTGSFSNTRTK